MTEERQEKIELRVGVEPDEDGDYWARVYVDGLWARSFHDGDRGLAIAAAKAFVDWRRTADTSEEVIDLGSAPSRSVVVRVVFDLETYDAPVPLGLYVRDDEDLVLYSRGGHHLKAAPHDCVAVVSVAVPVGPLT